MVSRRESLGVLAGAPLLSLVGAGSAAAAASAGTTLGAVAEAARNFSLTGTFMNSAYTHPLPLDTAAALKEFMMGRIDPALRKRSPHDPKALFAKLINAEPSEIAEVPSTSYGESFVLGALQLQGDRKAKIVTDILHFDGSLYAYGELEKQGTELTILPMTADGRIDLNRLEDAVDHRTRLVGISLVSMVNGFQHDLKAVCEIAHRKGAHVYVDAIQGAGAVPIDVRASGVDFLACSTFKWLMGDFGYGFLYVRGDLLPSLKRTQFGYHQPKTLAYHVLPGDPPGARLFEASPDNATAAGYFEVGSTSDASAVAAGVSLSGILKMGVGEIEAHRQPVLERLRARLGAKFQPLTPPGSRSPIIAFACPKAAATYGARMREAKVNIQLYENRFRVSPSVFNTLADADRVCDVMLG